jgi:hypothetical protein
LPTGAGLVPERSIPNDGKAVAHSAQKTTTTAKSFLEEFIRKELATN